MQSAGWYHAPGDPAGTVRYWDGAQWLGQAIAPQDRQTSGGYDLIPPQEPVSQSGTIDAVFVRPEAGARATQTTVQTFRGSRSDRLISSGAILLTFGIVFGIAGQNIVTYFSTPTEVAGTVTEVRQAKGRRQSVTLRIEVTTEVGQFYTSGRTTSFSPALRNSLQSNQNLRVTVLYSERTGGLIAIPELDRDLRVTGRYIWSVVAAVALVLALVRLYYEFNVSRDWLSVVFVLIFLVIGPLASLLVHDALDAFVTRLWDAP